MFFFFFSASADELFECKSDKNIGLNFLGGDHETILDYLKLKDFQIKVSRSRKDIYLQEKLRFTLKKNYLPKTSHFFEIILIKSSGYSIPMHCSWIFDIRTSKIKDKDFNCIGHPNNDRIFSLDYDGNFMYSSRFDEFFKNKKENKTLHSLIGKCVRKVKKN